MKRLSPDAIERGVEALRRLKQIADISEAPIRAVATSAVREAENRDEFLRAGARGRRRGRGHLGGRGGPPHPPRRPAGAARVRPPPAAVRHRRRQHRAAARPAAATCWRRAASSSAPCASPSGSSPASGSIRAPSARAGTFVRSTLAPFARDRGARLRHRRRQRRARSAALAGRWRAPPRRRARLLTSTASSSRADELTASSKRLVEARSVTERAKIPGLDAKRADIILAGALILERRMESFGIERMTCRTSRCGRASCSTPSSALSGGSLHHLRDAPLRSVQHLVEAVRRGARALGTWPRLALQLFDGTARTTTSTRRVASYLEAAALLGERRAVHLAQPATTCTRTTSSGTPSGSPASPTTRSR